MDKRWTDLVTINQLLDTLNSNYGYPVPPVNVVRRRDDGVWEMYVMVSDIPFMPTDRSRHGLFDHSMFESITYISKPKEMFLIVGYPQAVKNCIMVHLLHTFRAVVDQWCYSHIARLCEMPYMYPLHQRNAVPPQNRRELHFSEHKERYPRYYDWEKKNTLKPGLDFLTSRPSTM
jgi:hypothetical protein